MMLLKFVIGADLIAVAALVLAIYRAAMLRRILSHVAAHPPEWQDWFERAYGHWLISASFLLLLTMTLTGIAAIVRPEPPHATTSTRR